LRVSSWTRRLGSDKPTLQKQHNAPLHCVNTKTGLIYHSCPVLSC